MTEVSRPRGRPPKVRPEVAPALTEHDVNVAAAKTLDPDVAFKLEIPGVNAERKPVQVDRMVEVQLIRKYAPGGQKTEIQQTVPAGTVMELPAAEALRALKIGIARATDRSFD